MERRLISERKKPIMQSPFLRYGSRGRFKESRSYFEKAKQTYASSE
jgi:hypothetical protein